MPNHQLSYFNEESWLPDNSFFKRSIKDRKAVLRKLLTIHVAIGFYMQKLSTFKLFPVNLCRKLHEVRITCYPVESLSRLPDFMSSYVSYFNVIDHDVNLFRSIYKLSRPLLGKKASNKTLIFQNTLPTFSHLNMSSCFIKLSCSFCIP